MERHLTRIRNVAKRRREVTAMSNKPNPETQQPETFHKIALEIVHKGGPEPSMQRGPGAWDHFAAGVKNGLSDFVQRVLLGNHSPEPEPADKDKEIDR
jgi:hypothetical protein